MGLWNFATYPIELLLSLPSLLLDSSSSIPTALPALTALYLAARWFEYKWERKNYWKWDVADPEPTARIKGRIDTSTERISNGFPKDFAWVGRLANWDNCSH